MDHGTLSRNYDQFTPRERVRLTLAALARGDDQEAIRLNDSSCPRRTLAVRDPYYTELFDCMYDAVVAVAMCWVEVSHCLVHNRVRADDFNLLVLRCEAQIVDRLSNRGDSKQLDVIRRQYVAKKAEVDANCKMWSAFWTGIESAVTRFCEEIGLTRDQLFAMLPPVPPVLEEARHALDPEVVADHDREEAVYCRLCQGWRAERNPRDDPFFNLAGRAPQVNEP
jgi:hypothetical protein